MDYLPIFIRIKAQRVLIVGGGHVALRKINLLLRAGAYIRIVAPQIVPEITQLLTATEHEILQRQYQSSDLENVRLVVAATDNKIINQQIYDDSQELNLAVNVVDSPSLCNFIFPSIVDRSPVIVAVSSSGRSPMLARLLRARLETFIPSSYGVLADFLGNFRGEVRRRIQSISQRIRFWETILDGPVAELMMSGKQAQAESILSKSLRDFESAPIITGEVYLVGAGPGDPDLLTFRALRLMQQADVVLFDRLVSPQILNMTRQDAEKIHVGKQQSKHTMPQEEISNLLVNLAQQGKRVLRLKGGDPFIFGRGGEEIEKLAAEKIPFQIVPGITAASGCATYAGIPLTHRDYSQSVRFVTGHLKDGSCDLKWEHLVEKNETIVFYMGLISLERICQQLILHGRESNTPVALIQQGTTENQKVYTGTLDTIVSIIAANEVKAPTIIIVGEVVCLHEKLAWKD